MVTILENSAGISRHETLAQQIRDSADSQDKSEPLDPSELQTSPNISLSG